MSNNPFNTTAGYLLVEMWDDSYKAQLQDEDFNCEPWGGEIGLMASLVDTCSRVGQLVDKYIDWDVYDGVWDYDHTEALAARLWQEEYWPEQNGFSESVFFDYCMEHGLVLTLPRQDGRHNLAYEILNRAFRAGHPVEVAYEDDDEFMDVRTLKAAWDEVTACCSATVRIKARGRWEVMQVVNAPAVAPHETVHDCTDGGWISAQFDDLNEGLEVAI
ncbi:hypothetical protein PU634_10455 [Oceanimonas pelagia]|uniref:Uncharacterized protein n=1 Tax=Oceanimonas pelagia TaxID=3028314 RepID=A0AA50KM31_9GAMM|nr:hypothetical protein [Oceanimonas pelagia]WMC09537.1 hypothetical protein PU634_10455 [Oceanimonas pelagia]